ncbi:unnamed protein product [Nippostrongylus brasiliensis]|uniref:Probable 3',5'-cyclic phosphodiesterase pde-3 (inferred by orthology to a C. elegans protein) n=1 Tax=Nippostrongylus brasiliensis TaxID=27835 RepID=A0A0N4YK87_NIPBR|nr:unnamed protein product [Nippostrongylus brasiliensis]
MFPSTSLQPEEFFKLLEAGVISHNGCAVAAPAEFTRHVVWQRKSMFEKAAGSKGKANDQAHSGSLCDTVVTTVDGQKFDTKDLDNDRGLAMVADWSLPIFEIAEKHQKTILSRLTYTVFKNADLFRIFKLSPIKFFNFFHALERGYWDIPCESAQLISLAH